MLSRDEGIKWMFDFVPGRILSADSGDIGHEYAKGFENNPASFFYCKLKVDSIILVANDPPHYDALAAKIPEKEVDEGLREIFSRHMMPNIGQVVQYSQAGQQRGV